ncbi:MAG: leucine-rich repeat domain-containing protein, partial [Clostridia bacterium]|nr:leucine-rich repeat domain-containing protein [Clostridia bacterium]
KGSLTIGNSVTSMGNYAFYSCSGFTGSLTIGNSVISIGERAFYDCSGFTGSLIIPNSVTSIGIYAFYDCSGFTGSLTIGDSVISIGNSAFAYCSGFTGSLTIPDNVISIGGGAFGEVSANMTEIVVSANNTYFSDSKNALVEISTGRLIAGCNYTDLTILQEVTSIGTYAFYECSGLTGSLIIPDNVTSIGYYAFNSCSGFTGSLIIPNSVTSIENNAFTWCNGFTGSLIIPNSLISIGQSAFAYCRGLSSVYLPSTVTSINSSYSMYAPFSNCSSSLVIYTDVADASSKPSGWGQYWNYYSSSGAITVNYGYSLEQYKSAVGLTFVPGAKDDRNETSGINAYDVIEKELSVASDYNQEAIIQDKKETIALLKENDKVA